MKQLHGIQLKILKKLLFAESLKYSELKPDPKIENNQLSFHLDKLLDLGYIQKTENKYQLSSSWKEYANRMETELIQIKPQAKVAVLVCCVRGEAPNHELLIYTRKKQPFFGKQGFPTGKVRFGESIFDAAKRELEEEASLSWDPQLSYIKHSFVYEEKTNKLLEDKFFYVFLVRDPRGETQWSEEGPVERVARKDFETKLTNLYYDYDDLMKVIDAIVAWEKELSFEEITYKVSDF